MSSHALCTHLFNDSWGKESDSQREETHLNDDDDGDATDEKVDGVSSSFAIKYERLSSR